MSKPFVALYKCHRGGEWFRTSLDRLSGSVTGVVAVFGEPWVDTSVPENCSKPLNEFALANPHIPVELLRVSSKSQDEQYTRGMDFIKSTYGEDSIAMIVDTDEIWERCDVAKLREIAESKSNITYFRASMNTFVKSPIYQVWPQEPNRPTVAVNCKNPYRVDIRFSRFATSPNQNFYTGLTMNHYSYVRELFEDIELKFYATESQEAVRSRADWLTTVWPSIPDVANFHMAKGYESCWRGVRVLLPQNIPQDVRSIPFVRNLLHEDA